MAVDAHPNWYRTMRLLHLNPCVLILVSCLGLIPSEARGLDPTPEPTARPADPEQARERTCFQTHARWDPMLQLRSDVAICYGIDKTRCPSGSPSGRRRAISPT